MEIVSPKFLSWGAHQMYPIDITITLPFVRTRSSTSPIRSSTSPIQSSTSPTPLNPTPSQNASAYPDAHHSHLAYFRQITTLTSGLLILCAVRALCISSYSRSFVIVNDMFSIDLLAIHMIRGENTSTVISYHHPESMTSAEHFHPLMLVAGESAYWKDIFFKSKDPTYLVLAMLWYALYAWDESSDLLHDHLSSLVRVPCAESE
jgi:hypothetical protein